MNYRKIPFALGAYGPMYPNSSFLSGPAPMTKVTFRADTSKPAGIPGFIAWLAETHPEVYNYSFAVMPHNVRIAMNKLNPAEKLSARTDKDGRVRLKLRPGGMWLIKAVHMIPAPAGSNAEWQSFWASLTFEMKAPATVASNAR